ncbi:MAG: hypothetical protein MK180_11810 [Rhodobacteraceae bacterium]|nr:hypothetical protein [Paracoccaceae bacterium]
MINAEQFNSAADILGAERAEQYLRGALQGIPPLLEAVRLKLRLDSEDLEGLHHHLNTLAALGAHVLADQVASIETLLREKRPVDEGALTSAVAIHASTSTAFVELTGQTL